MRPFILREAITLPPSVDPPIEHIYDQTLQLWIDSQTGIPVVSLEGATAATRHGETLLTATREGADQSESATIDVPVPHDATGTRTNDRGRSAEAHSLTATRYGETAMTETREGADTSEAASAQGQDVDAPYSHF